MSLKKQNRKARIETKMNKHSIRKAIRILQESGIKLSQRAIQKALCGKPSITPADVARFKRLAGESWQTGERFAVGYRGIGKCKRLTFNWSSSLVKLQAHARSMRKNGNGHKKNG